MSTEIQNCIYCSNPKRCEELYLKLCELDTVVVYLSREQTYKGKCVIATKFHKTELSQLTDEEKTGFIKDFARVSGALQKVFNPTKINYAAFGDKMPHIHFHLVPKYEGTPEFGPAFSLNPEPKVFLPEEELVAMGEKIKAAL